MSHERVEQTVAELGRSIANEAVVIGSSAIACALPGFREPNDVDVAVPAEAFAHLREQPGWEEVWGMDGMPRLLKGKLDVGAGWGGPADYTELQARSWITENGVQVAGLPDVYAYKQRRMQKDDVADLQAVRTYLQDPARAPFSARQIPHELAAAWECLPAVAQDSPDAERAALLAANGMHIVYTLYGHPEIGQANQIIGDLEQLEFGVPATYHNGLGLVRDARALQQHLGNSGAPVSDRLLALAIDPYTDAIYGGGRFRNNPQGYDELRSAELLKGHALQLGYKPQEAERMHMVTLRTTFDEETGSQWGTHAADPLARAVTGVDLYPLARPESVGASFDLAVEDGFSARFSRVRTIGRVLGEKGARVYATVDGLRLIDHYADERPANVPDGPTVKQALAARLDGNAQFHRRHQYPDGWTLDNPCLREDHALALERASADLLAGKTATEAYLNDAQIHAARMSERYS